MLGKLKGPRKYSPLSTAVCLARWPGVSLGATWPANLQKHKPLRYLIMLRQIDLCEPQPPRLANEAEGATCPGSKQGFSDTHVQGVPQARHTAFVLSKYHSQPKCHPRHPAQACEAAEGGEGAFLEGTQLGS